MSKPDDIPQDVWDKAGDLAIDLARVGMLSRGASAVRGVVAHHQKAIVEAIMAAKAEERQAIEALVSEYVWDDHALEQATNIGLACHHQSLEILEAIRSRT